MRIASIFCKLTAFLIPGLLMSSTAVADEKRKIVFVPGIVGSVLSTPSGEIVWGDINSIRGSKFRRLDLMPSGESEDLVATDALRKIPLVLGAFEVGLYGELIDFLTGKTSFFDSRTSRSLVGDYVEGEDLFVFAYDWRRSNFANAVALDAFINENIPEGEFDIIAHSMGGILSRIMLSGQGPGPLCTQSGQQGDLSDADYQKLCTTIYGASPDGTWPSNFMSEPRLAADRLNTLMEIAVPHYGSVNVAATYSEGWGKISDILIGTPREIQNIALSWAAPLELIPNYENCCARGVPGEAGNEVISGLDEEFWMDLVLGFGVEPCPYSDCGLKQAIFRNGLASRRLIDAIMDGGLPPTVKANHGLIGRHVKNTRETLYIDFDATGDGDGLDFRIGSEGDGTVHRVSALLPGINEGATTTNFGVILRSGHPFITGHNSTQSYIFNTLLDPIDSDIQPVSGDVMSFANGLVETVGVLATPSIMETGASFDISLFVTQDENNEFDRGDAETSKIRVLIAPEGQQGEAIEVSSLVLDRGASRMLRGDLTYTGTGYQVETPGVYSVELHWRNTMLGKQFIYVLEEE